MAPPLLSPELSDLICQSIIFGTPLMHALEDAGVSKQTYYNWLKRGEAALEGDDIYVDFLDAVKKAKSTFVVRAVKRLQKAARNPRNWTAMAWLLERRHPEDFGKKEVEILNQQQKQIDDIRARLNASRAHAAAEANGNGNGENT
jgi:transposase